MNISQNFEAFSEYMNFTQRTFLFFYFQIRKELRLFYLKAFAIAKRNKKEKLRDKFYPKFNLNAAILKTNKNEKLRDKFTF